MNKKVITWIWFLASIVNFGLSIYDENLPAIGGWLSTILALILVLIYQKEVKEYDKNKFEGKSKYD